MESWPGCLQGQGGEGCVPIPYVPCCPPGHGDTDSPAGLAHFALGALPARALARRQGDIQAAPVVVLPTARAENQVPQVTRPIAHRAPGVLCVRGEGGQPSEPPPRWILPLWDPPPAQEGTQHPVPEPVRTHLQGLGQVLGTEQPQRLHGLEAAAGSGAGEVVEPGATGRPARDGGPQPLTVFTFLEVEQRGGVRGDARGEATLPAPPRTQRSPHQPPPGTRSPVRSLRKQL